MLKRMFLLMAMAVLVSSSYGLTVLPSSSYWQGWTTYDGGENISAYIEYAVYERSGTDDVSAFVGVGTGEYIYAYQIFTNPADGYDAIQSFIIPGTTLIETSALDGLGSVDDGTVDSVDGTPVDSGTTVGWTFEAGELVGGKQSWFLVFSTDAAPIAGDYELTTEPTDPFPNPGEGDDAVPEPATIALIALGIAPAIMKRRRR